MLVCQATGLTLMRSWLVGQVDDRLTDFRPPSPVYRDISGGTAPVHRPPAHEILPSDFRVYFYDAEGRLLPESLGDGRSEPRLRRTVTAGDPVDGRPATVPAEDGGGSWRVVADSGPDGMRAVVALPLDSVEEATSRLLWFSLGIGVATAAGVTLLGGAAVRLGLRPLTRVEHTARSITSGELEQNVTDTSPDTEVGRLGIAFNTMLDQLRAALHRKDRTERRLRRFMADAGHELRTPLTSLQGFAELLLHDPHMSASRRREAHELIAQNADRMSRLVDSLFLLAKLGDAPTTEHGPVDLLSLAADGIAATAVRHPERRVTLAPLGVRGAGDPGELDVVEGSGDPHQLAQVLSNLLDNACTHTPPGTRIEVRVGSLRAGPRTGGADRPGRTSANPPLPSGEPAHVIEVADDGPGLSPQDAAQVFDRFYRAQPAAALRGTASSRAAQVSASPSPRRSPRPTEGAWNSTPAPVRDAPSACSSRPARLRAGPTPSAARPPAEVTPRAAESPVFRPVGPCSADGSVPSARACDRSDRRHAPSSVGRVQVGERGDDTVGDVLRPGERAADGALVGQAVQADPERDRVGRHVVTGGLPRADAAAEGVHQDLHALRAERRQVLLGEGTVAQVRQPQSAEHRAVAPWVEPGVVEIGVADGVQPPSRVVAGLLHRGTQTVRQPVELLPDDGEHDGRLVGEVRVDRRGRDPDPACDRPQGDGAFVARLVEQLHRRGDDVLAQTAALAAAVAYAGPLRGRICRSGVLHPVNLHREVFKGRPLAE